jgi:diamine N-acetyltransferase
MVKISDGSIDDIPIIQNIAEKTWWPTYSPFISAEQIRYMLDAIYSEDALRKVLDNGSQTFLILHNEKGAQGFASYGLRPENHQICKLHKLYVLPDNHGKGYGRMLIDAVVKKILSIPVYTLDLNVNRYNQAQAFYERIGFKVIKEEDVPIGPYWMNDYVMRLEVKS